MIDDSVPTYLLCIGSLLKLGYLEFKIGYGHAAWPMLVKFLEFLRPQLKEYLPLKTFRAKGYDYKKLNQKCFLYKNKIELYDIVKSKLDQWIFTLFYRSLNVLLGTANLPRNAKNYSI